ncbi:hypothetical protein CK501_13270 [Halovibrio salipaludis]|uniref:SbsA Ig-like domain-containing protein n=1 Tax=Halovibrio salipaludis TaxID=2032626 RepID=A0A2A2F279_9GAMM|nr:Ig-like domain-containing protein [Halovibrio salipaludis]PAU78653.1 hypothetical protein CK501_13270 [Halovibrio salipaludis]
MKQQYTLALIPLLLLTGCMGGEEQSDDIEVSASGSGGDTYLSYSYPTDGQADVSPEAEVVMRFSHAIADSEGEATSKIQLQKDGEKDVQYSLEKVDGGRSLVLTPNGGLDAQSDYSVTFEGGPLLAADGSSITEPNAQGEPGIQFSTRNLYDGPNNRVEGTDSFEVASAVPLPDSQKSEPGQFGPMNFSTFRLRTTHPVHPQWRDKGGTIELTDSSGEAVDANVIVRGNNISVDPCVTESLAACGSRDDVLEAGETYTLSLDNVPSKTDGDQLLNQEFKYTPRETGPTVVAEQITVDSGLASGESESQATKSILNGQVINGVTLNSVLQGVTDTSQQTGSLFAELGYAPSFGSDEPLPLRIPRNSVLRSTSIDVKVGGEVPILKAREGDGNYGPQETTGDIKVTMISDANGYLSPNPYTDNDNAPRHVTLFMDIAMNTESEQPNAALSQDLMSVELRGIAMVRDGVLTIDAIGVVEPELLGQEYTDSTIAFNLKGDISEDAPTDAADLRPVDDEGPKLLSWMPGPENAVPDTRQAMQRPGDPVILNFNEPIRESSVEEGISLYANNFPVQDFSTKVDGTTVTINPEGGLKHGVDYRVDITNKLTDLAGNGRAIGPLTFSLPAIDDGSGVTPRSPIALTTYPGYPCETTQDAVDLEEGTHGQCWDAAPDGEAGDVLPVTKMPADRPIVVVFSQSMNRDSIRLGETFIVEKVSQSDVGGTIGEAETVEGRLEKNNQRVRFYPDEPWDEDSFYRYTMVSAESGDCSNVICGANGQALQTDLLEDPTDNGGQPMTIYFEGVAKRQVEDVDWLEFEEGATRQSVFTPLRNLPIRDVNSNYEIDCASLDGTDCLEPWDHLPNGEGGYKPSANAAKLQVVGQKVNGLSLLPSGAAVGCAGYDEDTQCPEKKFIYQTYGLNTEVVGPAKDLETGKRGVGVLLYPTMLATTSASVYLEGLEVLGESEQATGPQLLRMRYAQDKPSCTSDCSRTKLIPGIIVEGDDNGSPVFKTKVDLALDAPALEPSLGASHDLFSKPFPLELKGDITFFDDGRMQVVQKNSNHPEINVNIDALEIGDLPGIVSFTIPLEIPRDGIYLNFISNPVKDLPQRLRQTASEQ